MTRRTRAGFTLVELVIVLVIVAILIAILFPRFRAWQQARSGTPAAIPAAPAAPATPAAPGPTSLYRVPAPSALPPALARLA